MILTSPGTDISIDPTGGDKVATVDFLNIEMPETTDRRQRQPSNQPVWFDER